MSCFSWPAPKSPPPLSSPVVVIVEVDDIVDVVLSVVEVWCCPCESPFSDSDSWSSADCPSRSPVVVVCVEIVWDSVVLAAGWLSDELTVICARPTPAAAANARPTSAPTKERRVRRVSRLRTLNPFRGREVVGLGDALRTSVVHATRNLRRAPSMGGGGLRDRAPTDGGRTRLRRGVRSGGPAPVCLFRVRVLFPRGRSWCYRVRAGVLGQMNDGGTVGRVRLVAFDQLVTRDLFANGCPQHPGTATVDDVDTPQPCECGLIE